MKHEVLKYTEVLENCQKMIIRKIKIMQYPVITKSCVIRAMHVSMVYVPMCKTHANFALLRVNKRSNVLMVCQLFDFACQRVYQFFNYFSKEFFNFWIFQLSQHLKISRNKEFKFWHVQNFIHENPGQPTTFDVVFNGACAINQSFGKCKRELNIYFLFT